MKRIFKYTLICAFAIIIFTISIKPVTTAVYKVLYPLRYEEYINKYSKEYELDRFFVMALIKAESNYINDAHSSVAHGLMQITDDTALWISEKLSIDFEPDDIVNPETNIKMGCFYLDYLLNYYKGNVKLSLAAYNAGMGNVDKWLKNPQYSKNGISLDVIPFAETKKYIEKIEKGTTIYKKLYNKED